MSPTTALDFSETPQDPRAGLRQVRELRRYTEALELTRVEEALAEGLNWQEIAVELDVSRQAVHKKYAKRVRPGLAPRRGPRA